jgi:anthranilate synthase/aminodeoxychorismate synthase-like glutamine amidotransferase
MIDNYDSFTFNLVQAFGMIDPNLRVDVRRNDRITLDEIDSLRPSHIVISPGPCTPRESGICNDLIRTFAPQIPILGVCLGHQCIGFVAGAVIERAHKLMHGKTDLIHHDGKTLYTGLRNPFTATRYHSLIIREGTLPDDFEVSARTPQNEIMGIRHKRYPLEGVQYHPESFLTEESDRLLTNFLRQVR